MIRSRLVPQKILVFLLFGFFIITALNLQTTVWFSFFGFFPAPCFWAPFFVYLMMNRPFPKTFFWLLFFYILFLTQTSAVPLTLFLALTTLWGTIVFFQKRFSSLGMFDLIAFSAASTVLFPLIYFAFSVVTESLVTVDVLNIVITLFLSIPIIPASLFICKSIDAAFEPISYQNDSLVLDI